MTCCFKVQKRALNPAASLRGGLRQPESGKRGGSGKAGRVEQLDLLRAILDDPDAPKAFKDMASPGKRLEGSQEAATDEGEAAR